MFTIIVNFMQNYFSCSWSIARTSESTGSLVVHESVRILLGSMVYYCFCYREFLGGTLIMQLNFFEDALIARQWHWPDN
jgi:hypothetical protein